MASQLSELAVDLGAVRERERRVTVGDPVPQAALEVDLLLPLWGEPVDEAVDRLPAVGIAAVHGLHGVSGGRRTAGAIRLTDERVPTADEKERDVTHGAGKAVR